MEKLIVKMPTKYEQLKEFDKMALNVTAMQPKNGKTFEEVMKELTWKIKTKELEEMIQGYKKEGEYVEKDKTEVERFNGILKEMEDTFKRKNADYGNSTSDTFESFGMVSYIVRIADKYNRLKTLCKKEGQEVNDESIRDTLLDMANYCVLAIKDLDK